ncbi:LytR C-terminal domain-containing protein [Janthinobacterium lividum]|uniref:Tetratricopeptide repeat protein n=1 Tax=Janthinobacterium lividum TaxID=29581 RepID=A0ABU0Y0L1_9BURK|nr:LytR C-terminal domain-containing protein [Janthinobacterium lividum]MDQ4629147.1 tetratricopeptide repeat protein [Janthinobacterium lividum]MDQ4677329.1 tetratricopeptide repeat protein [Janthinobacterium lividum]MDQ4688105.1 tetratricopeptide repeat protein [Janthinobacterium lividum]
MSQHTTLMLMLACAGLLPACGHLPGPASQGNHVAPPQARIDDSPATRTAAFCKLGKRMLELGDPRAALAAYREALLLEPDSADARNGAAVLHAQLGQLETARSMLQALALQAPTARTYNNLGYVLYLQGEYAQAADALRQSLQLDNGQQPARANLDLAIAALARSIGTVDATAEAIAPDLAPAPMPAAPASRLQLTQLQPNIFALSWRDAPVVAQAAPAAIPALAKPAMPLPRLEVINGNGETGMAARMRGMLGGMGISVLRLGNQRPYGIQASSIVYRPGHAEAAAALALALGGMPQLQAAGDSGIGAGADLRLLLGKDAAASLRAPDMRLASNTAP